MFEDPNAPPEEKTVAPVGPKNEVPMQESTELPNVRPPVASEAPIPEDLRNPVGLDAGAPEVTDTAEDDGGWHGGAEDEKGIPGVPVKDAAQEQLKVQEGRPPVGAKVEVPDMELDSAAKNLAEEAMRADEEGA